MGDVVKLREVSFKAEPCKGTVIIFCHQVDASHIVTIVAYRDIENGLWTVTGDYRRRHWERMVVKYPALLEGSWVRMIADL